MAESTLSVSVLDIIKNVQRYMGFGRDTPWGDLAPNARGDVIECVNRGLRQFYAPAPLPNESSSHEWSFLKGNTTVVTEAPYTTGFIDFTSGTAITGNGTSWTTGASWVGRVIKINSDLREITAIGSSTALTVDRALTSDIPNDSNQTSYEIYALVYDLPDDFGGLRGSITFYDGDGYLPLKITNESNMRMLRSQNDIRKHNIWAKTATYGLAYTR